GSLLLGSSDAGTGGGGSSGASGQLRIPCEPLREAVARQRVQDSSAALDAVVHHRPPLRGTMSVAPKLRPSSRKDTRCNNLASSASISSVAFFSLPRKGPAVEAEGCTALLPLMTPAADTSLPPQLTVTAAVAAAATAAAATAPDTRPFRRNMEEALQQMRCTNGRHNSRRVAGGAGGSGPDGGGGSGGLAADAGEIVWELDLASTTEGLVHELRDSGGDDSGMAASAAWTAAQEARALADLAAVGGFGGVGGGGGCSSGGKPGLVDDQQLLPPRPLQYLNLGSESQRKQARRARRTLDRLRLAQERTTKEAETAASATSAAAVAVTLEALVGRDGAAQRPVTAGSATVLGERWDSGDARPSTAPAFGVTHGVSNLGLAFGGLGDGARGGVVSGVAGGGTGGGGTGDGLAGLDGLGTGLEEALLVREPLGPVGTAINRLAAAPEG
ncbi:unnamed protein product, partial [Phaeothamnion confervicola]